MLIAFLFFLSNTTTIKITVPIILSVIVLDWIMLLFGYLGEIGYIDRNLAFFAGFAPLIVIFGIMYQLFFRKKFVLFNAIIFILFIIFWGLYGIGYMFELEPRNYLMNILDLLSKSGFGLLFAFYFLYRYRYSM